MSDSSEIERHRRITAYHEAGHAIVGCLRRYHFSGVELNGPESLSAGGVDFDQIIGPLPEDNELLDTLIMVRLAGIQAEEVFIGHADLDAAWQEMEEAKTLAKRRYPDFADRDCGMEHLRRSVNDLLDKHRPAVEAVANALLLRGRLSYDDVTEMLKVNDPTRTIAQYATTAVEALGGFLARRPEELTNDALRCLHDVLRQCRDGIEAALREIEGGNGQA